MKYLLTVTDRDKHPMRSHYAFDVRDDEEAKYHSHKIIQELHCKYPSSLEIRQKSVNVWLMATVGIRAKLVRSVKHWSPDKDTKGIYSLEELLA